MRVTGRAKNTLQMRRLKSPDSDPSSAKFLSVI